MGEPDRGLRPLGARCRIVQLKFTSTPTKSSGRSARGPKELERVVLPSSPPTNVLSELSRLLRQSMCRCLARERERELGVA